MNRDPRSSSTDIPPEVSAYFRRIGKGWRTWDRAKRSLVSRIMAEKGWETRRARYGPSGRKLIDARLAARLDGQKPGEWKKP